jgi:hypothetical protein
MSDNPNGGSAVGVDDISPTMHDPRTNTRAEVQARYELEDYFREGQGSLTERLENFVKFVPRQNIARLLARYEMLKAVLDIQGSIVECGSLFGNGLLTFAKLSTILEPYNFQRRIIGFDSFAGFPSVADEDLAGDPERKSLHLKEGGFTVEKEGFSSDDAYEDVLRGVEIYDKTRFLNHFPKVKVVKGDFLKTGPQFLEDHPHLIVSLLYLDFDIYEPTKKALELFLPRVPKGGMVVFDELNDEGFPGETTAVLEELDIKQWKIRRFEWEPRISYAIVGD